MARKPPPGSDSGIIARLRQSWQPRFAARAATLASPLAAGLDSTIAAQLRENEHIWKRFRQIELAMFDADSLADVVTVLVTQLPAAFPSVHAVSVAWLDPEREWSRELQRSGVELPVTAFVSLPSIGAGYPPPHPQLGPMDPDVQRRIFPGVSAPLRSVALMPLRLRGELIGCLNQASLNPEHFSPVVATDLLEHLAAMTALCMDNAANRARLRRDGLTDALTGVANRRFFDRRLQEEISLWRRHGASLSCLLVDIDHFKRINDRFGHPAGDRVLQAIAQQLSLGLRSSDVLARYGGEEFALLLPATDGSQAGEIAERLRSAIEHMQAPSSSDGASGFTVSIGLAVLEAAQRRSLREPPDSWLLQQADQALYRAKALGRNRVVGNDTRGTAGSAKA